MTDFKRLGAKHIFKCGELSLIAIFTRHGNVQGISTNVADDILNDKEKTLLYKLIEKYVLTAQYEEAFKVAMRYISQCEGNFAVIAQLAYVSNVLGKKQIAVQYAEKALELNQESNICKKIIEDNIV